MAAAWSLAWGPVGIAQVRVEGELGWQGQAVVGEVNPLTIAIENGTGSVLSATVRAEQRMGSGWRGQVTQRLRAPVVLAPGGRARFVFPWPVEAGSAPLEVRVEADGAEQARTTVPVRAVVEKPIALAGTVTAPPTFAPTLTFAPRDLPADPLLLSPFAAVQVAAPRALSADAHQALAAWAAFGGGRLVGEEAPAVAPLLESDLRDAVRRHRPRPAPAGVLLGATALYLFLLGYALPPLSRRGRSWGAFGLVTVVLCFAVFYPHLYDSPQNVTYLSYSLSVRGIDRFALDLCAITSRRGGVHEALGWWIERTFPGSERSADIEWVWGAAGPQTLIRVDQGETVFLWRYGQAWSAGGIGNVVRPDWTATVEPGFAPLLGAVGPLLREGDRVHLERIATRDGAGARYVYRLRADPRG